jgi:hypothetical protein
MKKPFATFILSTAVLCFGFVAARAQAQVNAGPYTAVVKKDEARFTLPAPQRPEWKWRRPETRENAQEYRMDVTVRNEGTEYTFGFYVWKRAGARPGKGSFSDLLAAGQKSVFGRDASGRGFSLIRDAGVKVGERGDTLLITVSGRENVARLFSGKPAEVTFKIVVPEADPVWKTVPVTYQD